MSGASNTFFRVFTYMKPVQGKYFAGSALASCELIILFAIPLVNRMLVEMITEGGGHTTVREILLIMAVLLALAPLVAIGRYWQSLCSQTTADSLKKTLFGHIQRLPLSKLAERQSGDYLMRLNADADRAGHMFQGFAVVSLLRFVVVTSVTMTLLLLTEWRIAALALVYNLICFGLSLLVNPYVNKLEREARQEIAASSNIVLETMRSLPIVRVFMLGHTLGELYRSRCEQIRQKRSKFRAANGVAYGVVDFFSFSSQAVGFIAAIFLLGRGEMALNEAVYTASLMALASDAMLRLSTFILLIQPSLVSAGRVFEVLDEPGEMLRESTAKLDMQHKNAIELSNMGFSYPESAAVLQGINLTIKRGEKIALVGGSGGGKTTLAQIIASLYEPTEGSISFFGAEGSRLSRQDLRKLIAYVPQESILFEGSIYDNIQMVKPELGPDEIKKAAHSAGLDISLDTQVGERGSLLSGGQRQRVAIARAIAKAAPIIIFDEATSALDSDTEALVQNNLKSATYTSITVAHRLSTIKESDKIYVIEKGNIAEAGSHEDLLKLGGRYANLAQVGE